MSDSNSLINLGDLAKPVTTLIEKIADATGALYENRRIVKRAKAEAEASLIKAKSEIEISDLQKRALHRFVQEEGKKQENIESIMEKSIPLLAENSKPEEMDNDWVASFLRNADWSRMKSCSKSGQIFWLVKPIKQEVFLNEQ